MKNRVLCQALLIALSPLSVQACLYNNTEKLSQALASNPLSQIEKQLVINRIKEKGLYVVSQELHNSQSQNSLYALSFQKTFHKHETDSLTKNVFDEIEEIEGKSQQRTEAIIPHNYLGLTTLYRLNRDHTIAMVDVKLSNRSKLQEICNNHKD